MPVNSTIYNLRPDITPFNIKKGNNALLLKKFVTILEWFLQLGQSNVSGGTTKQQAACLQSKPVDNRLRESNGSRLPLADRYHVTRILSSDWLMLGCWGVTVQEPV